MFWVDALAKEVNSLGRPIKHPDSFGRVPAVPAVPASKSPLWHHLAMAKHAPWKHCDLTIVATRLQEQRTNTNMNNNINNNINNHKKHNNLIEST